MISITALNEAIFLAIANHLPRARLSDRVRPWILRRAGLRIGRRCAIWGPVTIRPIGAAKKIVLGDRVFINTECRLGANGGITIGNHVAIGPRVSLETSGHGLVHVPGKGRGTFSKAIHIQDGAWLGAGVIVTPGVTIGENSVIAAGCVLTTDAEPWSLYGGVPGRLIRRIAPDEAASPER